MKYSSVYVCQKCGFESPKWAGKCPECGEWNTLVETSVSTRSPKSKVQSPKSKRSEPLKLEDVESARFSRIKTGIGELDQVLGGGVVPGSVILLAGEPGMGKSTLLTQLALELAKVKSEKLKVKSNKNSGAVFYVCGEESPGQVKLRIERIMNYELGIRNQNHNSKFKIHDSNLYLFPETNVESIIAGLGKHKVRLVIIDSIQTLWTDTLTGMAGSVGQIRETANILADYAKRYNVPIFLVGHVTKEGSIAGPKVLEHLVDTVLYLEGDKNHEFRILRAVKNRFGPTDEVGIFTMGDEGMKEVSNPSEMFVESSSQQPNARNQKPETRSGSCKVVAMQGLRPVVVEIQALVTPTQIPVPRRVGQGVDAKRLQILCAVLQKKAGINLFNQDVYLNVAGGLKLLEPAVDFGICLAVASSYKNKIIPEKAAVIGEVSLLGEIRKVNFLEKRIKQAKSLGFGDIAGPEQYSTLREAVGKMLK